MTQPKPTTPPAKAPRPIHPSYLTPTGARAAFQNGMLLERIWWTHQLTQLLKQGRPTKAAIRALINKRD